MTTNAKDPTGPWRTEMSFVLPCLIISALVQAQSDLWVYDSYVKIRFLGIQGVRLRNDLGACSSQALIALNCDGMWPKTQNMQAAPPVVQYPN